MLLAELTATFGTENLKLRSIIKLLVKLNKSLLCLLNKLKPDPAFFFFPYTHAKVRVFVGNGYHLPLKYGTHAYFPSTSECKTIRL